MPVMTFSRGVGDGQNAECRMLNAEFPDSIPRFIHHSPSVPHPSLRDEWGTRAFQRFDVSAFQRFDVSTFQRFSVSAFQRFDVSAFHPQRVRLPLIFLHDPRPPSGQSILPLSFL